MKAVAIKFLNITGMKWGIPLVKLFSGEQVLQQLKEISKTILAPILAIIGFLLVWSFFASQITTSLGRLPGPGAVWEQTQSLWQEHLAERVEDVGRNTLHEGQRGGGEFPDHQREHASNDADAQPNQNSIRKTPVRISHGAGR